MCVHGRLLSGELLLTVLPFCLQDISAKAPIVAHDLAPRQSLDSAARLPRLPRSSLNDRRFDREPPTPEEGFEDVGLNDDQKQHPKKRGGFFAKFGGEHQHQHQQQQQQHHQEGAPASNSNNSSNNNLAAVSRLLLPGRKRGQSGSGGAELGQIERPTTATSSMQQEVHA